MIKLKCLSTDCQYTYEISEKEFLDNVTIYEHCLVCGSQLTVENVEEIVKLDLEKRAENFINKWIREIGWDNTLDLIARHKGEACYRIYKEILEKRGFKIK